MKELGTRPAQFPFWEYTKSDFRQSAEYELQMKWGIEEKRDWKRSYKMPGKEKLKTIRRRT
jgi:hypothetical protein